MIKYFFSACLLISVMTAEASPSLDANAVTLTRFAIQSLYAPKRLITTPEGIYRVPMQTEKHVPLFYGASLDAMPLASWRSGNLFVTAVELKNLTSQAQCIDVKTIQGNWQTAAIYPISQLPSREKHQTTTVFLVSNKPFQEALSELKEYVR